MIYQHFTSKAESCLKSVLRLIDFNIFSDALESDYKLRLLILHSICSRGTENSLEFNSNSVRINVKFLM